MEQLRTTDCRAGPYMILTIDIVSIEDCCILGSVNTEKGRFYTGKLYERLMGQFPCKCRYLQMGTLYDG